VPVAVGVPVSVAVPVSVPVSVTVNVSVGVPVSVTVPVAVPVEVTVNVWVTVKVCVIVGVFGGVSVGSGVSVSVGVSVTEGVSVIVAVTVTVSVSVRVGVIVEVWVNVSVGTVVAVDVIVGVRVGMSVLVATGVAVFGIAIVGVGVTALGSTRNVVRKISRALVARSDTCTVSEYGPGGTLGGAVTRTTIVCGVNAAIAPIFRDVTSPAMTPRDQTVTSAERRSPVVWNGISASTVNPLATLPIRMTRSGGTSQMIRGRCRDWANARLGIRSSASNARRSASRSSCPTLTS
jgi:hypothetical protein